MVAGLVSLVALGAVNGAAPSSSLSSENHLIATTESESSPTAFSSYSSNSITTTNLQSVSATSTVRSPNICTNQQENLLAGNRSDLVLVGGQNGTWFTPSQFPRLYAIILANETANELAVVPSEGTVWGGGTNGTEYLVTGWGNCDDPISTNPFLEFVTNDSISYGALGSAERDWMGGDIFSVSSNGSHWLLVGMGSGYDPVPTKYGKYHVPMRTNHFSVGMYNGNETVDLTGNLPTQAKGILYACANNGSTWLLGGGYEQLGKLYSFNGRTFTDLTTRIRAAVPSFQSVQSIAWNGKYWLIGGVGFLAEYENQTFTNLTKELNATLLPTSKLVGMNAVNSISWNGSSWLVGGGAPVGIERQSSAWLATLSSGRFEDLTPQMIESLNYPETTSDILSISNTHSSWVVGGYDGDKAILLRVDNGTPVNLSNLLGDMHYVDWVG